MNNIDHIENIYFIGIGGIGMSALARFFKSQGKNVAGYDKTATELTKALVAEDIPVIYRDAVDAVPGEFLEDKESLIVYTPAVPKDHHQFEFFMNQDYVVIKRAALLGLVTRDRFTLAVAGTHGKTTTTAILAHLLKESNAEVTAFLGGISEELNSNLMLNGDKVVVVEADEFDRSFLHLSPNIAAITSMDADHLDIYGVEEHLQASFRSFAGLVPKDGKLFVKNGLPLDGITIGIEDDSDFTAVNIKVENGAYRFDLETPNEVIKDLQFYLPGKHNLLNAITALAMAITFGSPTEDIARALYSFKGVKRRFTYKIKSENFVLIDDYAHHPAEIAAVYQAVREMHPGKKVLAIFQPHLYSRTRDFSDEFAANLSKFEEVVLLDIYPAREKPIQGITSEWLLEKIDNEKKALLAKEELYDKIKHSSAEVVVLMGAGDIGVEAEKLTKKFADES
ncbi:UDP-N-acetylmuramate--L-alanine ligase [Salegentibacter chungangensis]|uniref:UDP-N-acetylmuramate--L-alanine ligase n=1 Tax=Salegentibacter chungangensis TaxID=1335724 RepID=A0ABW3NW15_9FLAO